jgi:hypothetical protein
MVFLSTRFAPYFFCLFNCTLSPQALALHGMEVLPRLIPHPGMIALGRLRDPHFCLNQKGTHLIA